MRDCFLIKWANFDKVSLLPIALWCYSMRMEVYLEIVIADNFLISYCLGSLSYRLSMVKKSRVRLAIASAIGTLVALFYPFIRNPILLISTKITLWILLSAILFWGKSKFFRGGLIFLLLTFLFGGIVFGISYFLTGSIDNALLCDGTVPFSVIVVCVYLGNLTIKKLSSVIRARCDAENFIYEFSLKIFGKTKRLRGFLDTGNRLYDEKEGLPIVVVGLNTAQSFFSDEQVRLFLLGKGDRIQENARYISFSALGKSDKKILLLKPEQFLLYFEDKNNIFYDVTIGVLPASIRDGTHYDAILHPALLNGGKNA